MNIKLKKHFIKKSIKKIQHYSPKKFSTKFLSPEEQEQERIAFKRSFSTTGFTPDNYQLMNQAAEIYIDKLAEGCDHFLAYNKAMEFYDYWAYYEGGEE